MHRARRIHRVTTSLSVITALTFALSGSAHADRTPLVGSDLTGHQVPSSVTPATGMIIPIDPSQVPCAEIARFDDVAGGPAPGTNYDGVVMSGGLQFAERFLGQTQGVNDVFDVITGTPSNPLTLQVGSPGQNLDVFEYTTNALAGLGALGFPDIDAIGEGAMAIYFPSAQSLVSFSLVGGNGGSATLSFYRADGSLIDDVLVSGLADLSYGFATADASPSISGILVQNTDPSGIGIVNICHNGGIVATHPMTWGRIKTLYR
jgi:hypothetical protein